MVTTNQLIIDAHRLANIYAEDEEPTAPQMQRGLDYINETLDSLSGNGIQIPYTNTVTFNTQAGKDTYTFSREVGADVNTNKIIEITDVYLTYGDVRFPMEKIEHDQAYQLVRYPTAKTRPTQVFMQNTNFGTELVLFYNPDDVYPITVRGKQVLDNVALGADLTNVPPNYRKFLRYALGRELSNVFDNGGWSDKKEKEYMELLNNLHGTVDNDWSINSSGILRQRYIGWTKGSIVAG